MTSANYLLCIFSFGDLAPEQRCARSSSFRAK